MSWRNDWLAVNQFTRGGGQAHRRPDVVLFVNGLPLAVMELKNAARRGGHDLERLSAAPDLPGADSVALRDERGAGRVGRRAGARRTLGAGKEWFKPWRTIAGEDVPRPRGGAAGGAEGLLGAAALPRSGARLHRLRGRRQRAHRQEDGRLSPVPRRATWRWRRRCARRSCNMSLLRRRLVRPEPAERYRSCVPFVPLKAAAGAFSDPQHVPDGDFEWVEVETRRKLRPGMFVARVEGHSMEPEIPDGALCLFSAPVEGWRQGKAVLVQLHDEVDPETGERYTVKRYESEKASAGGSWRHARITLKPANPDYPPIILLPEQAEQLQVVAEVVEVLGVSSRENARPGDRRVGVVWHTQGSGKSLTMAFYAGRVILAPGDGEPDASSSSPTATTSTTSSSAPSPAASDLLRQTAGAGGGPRRPARAARGRLRRRRLHHHPEVLPRGEGRPPPGALRPAQHRRHRRRGAPQPVRLHRRLRPAHARRAAERLVHRLHRHADRADRREHPRRLRRLHQRLRHPARGRGRRHGADLLREPARQARAERVRAAAASTPSSRRRPRARRSSARRS